jgi:prephenate dehydrogenase
MTGKEKTGYTESSSELFVSATYILCRSNFTDEETFFKVLNIIKGIGGICVELNAKEQDQATSLISHLPHVVAFALVNTIKEADNPILKKLAAGGFKDITRIASSDAEMWENIFLTNKESINKVISDFVKKLKLFQNMINNDSSTELKKFMTDAKNYRDSIN